MNPASTNLQRRGLAHRCRVSGQAVEQIGVRGRKTGDIVQLLAIKCRATALETVDRLAVGVIVGQ